MTDDPDDSPTLVRSTFSRGVIHYPARSTDDGTGTLAPTQGTLIVVKAGVPADAPWDVASYHERFPRFPTDPTSDQLFPAPSRDVLQGLRDGGTVG